jgi:hypothetical protein
MADQLTLAQFERPQLTFDSATHTYRWSGVKCISVTTLIGLFKQPFDDKKMATQKALERGGTADAILTEWAKLRDDAADYGNKAHAIAAEETAARHPDRALAEVPVCLPTHLIAGTVDLLCVREDGTKCILDWKTNKRIELVGYNYMLPPLQVLFDNTWNHYCLQLGLYAHILREAYDFDATKLVLAHIPKDGPRKWTYILDYRKHVEKLLEWREQHLDKPEEDADEQLD